MERKLVLREWLQLQKLHCILHSDMRLLTCYLSKAMRNIYHNSSVSVYQIRNIEGFFIFSDKFSYGVAGRELYLRAGGSVGEHPEGPRAGRARHRQLLGLPGPQWS